MPWKLLSKRSWRGCNPKSSVARNRSHSGRASRNLNGIELSGDVARFLQTIDTHQTDDFSEGDPVDLSTYWQLAMPADIVAPSGARLFEAAVEYEREHFANGFGLLQVILPAVPVACLERRDHLFVSLFREEAFVLPQEVLFDPEANDLYLAGTSLASVATLLDRRVRAVLDALVYDEPFDTRSAYLSTRPCCAAGSGRAQRADRSGRASA